MISAINDLGYELIRNNKYIDLFYNKVEKIKPKKKNQEFYLCNIDFTSNERCIKISFIPVNDKNNDQIAQKYLWIGNLIGNKTQWHITTDKLCYALNSLYVLYNNIPNNYSFKQKLADIISLYFNSGNIGYLKYTIDIMDKKYDFEPKINTKLLNSKDLLDSTDNFHGYYSKIALYTISIDGKPLAEEDDYKKMLIESTKADVGIDYYEGTCSICGKHKKVTYDTKKLQFKYYNTDKSSFAFEIDNNNFKKNFSLCSGCYQNIITGEDYILKHLKTYLGNNSLLIIPEPIPFKNFQLDIEKVFNITNKVITQNNEIIGMEDKARSGYTINLMFYEKNQNYFKITDFIPEIPESRILKIGRYMYCTSKKFENVSKFGLSISGFYQSIFIKSQGKGRGNVKESLEIIIRLLKFTKINQEQLTKIYLHKIRDSYYQGNIKKGATNIINMYAYEKFLESIDLVNLTKGIEKEKVGDKMDNVKIGQGLNFIKQIASSEEVVGLFCIGYAIRCVGRVLYKHEIKNNPLLEKINYQGMDFVSVKKLVNQIDEKVKQYDDINGRDISYALFKAHSVLAEYIQTDWPISDVENVFFIMTGYSIENEFIYEKNNDIEKKNNGE